MFIVMGGTGHVGGAVARTLLSQGEPVTIVTRDAANANVPAGAFVAEAEIADTDRLRAIFREGTRAFLLIPPGAIDRDTDVEEARSIDALLGALAGSGLEKIVAASTFGARPGTRIGDAGTLHRFETGLRAQPIPTVIQRGAYYMSNWDAHLAPARDEGRITSFFPADMALPMVAPADLGTAAARWLTEPVEATGLRNVEGPGRYSADDVACVFSDALGRKVEADVVPRDRWEETYRMLGFSREAAESYAGMTRLAADMTDFPRDAVRGSTTLAAYIGNLVARCGPAHAG